MLETPRQLTLILHALDESIPDMFSAYMHACADHSSAITPTSMELAR
jgi:hypothetical protein